MPQPCSICRHEHQAEIDRQLVDGASLRNIAKQFGTSATALHRHKKHLAPALSIAKEAAQAADAGTLLDRVNRLLGDAERITTQAEHAKQLDIALRGIREVRGILELLGRVSAELAAREAAKSTGPGSRESVKEKLRQKLLGMEPRTEEEAMRSMKPLCDKFGLLVVPNVALDSPEENERRLAELLTKAGITLPEPTIN
jgi:hypothetical protein